MAKQKFGVQVIQSYTGDAISVLGCVQTLVSYEGQTAESPLVVVQAYSIELYSSAAAASYNTLLPAHLEATGACFGK